MPCSDATDDTNTTGGAPTDRVPNPPNDAEMMIVQRCSQSWVLICEDHFRDGHSPPLAVT